MVWYGDEIWHGGREKDYDGDGRIEEVEVLRWCDEAFGGRCFKPWTAYRHPVLGELEIGRGALYWTGRNRQKSKRISWTRFAEMMDELASTILRTRRRSA